MLRIRQRIDLIVDLREPGRERCCRQTRRIGQNDTPPRHQKTKKEKKRPQRTPIDNNLEYGIETVPQNVAPRTGSNSATSHAMATGRQLPRPTCSGKPGSRQISPNCHSTVNRTYDKSDRTDKGNRAPGLTLCGIDGLARIDLPPCSHFGDDDGDNEGNLISGARHRRGASFRLP